MILANFNANEVEEFPFVYEAFDFAFVNTQRQESLGLAVRESFLRGTRHIAMNMEERERELLKGMFGFRSVRMDHADSARAPQHISEAFASESRAKPVVL